MRPLTFDDLISIPRIGQVAVSPDGTRAAFVTAHHDAKKNTVRRTIRVVELESGEVSELTPGPGNHGSPAWSPDGKWLAFVSGRDEKQGAQLWLLPLEGGEARRITSGYGGVGSPVWAPDSTRIAFSRSVIVSEGYDKTPDPAKGPVRGEVYGLVNPKSSARVEDRLLFRHWNHWVEKERSHVFVVDVFTGELADCTPGDWDSPPISLESAQDFVFSPDGATLAFVANPDEVVARSTNNSIWLVALDRVKPAGEPRNVSINAACDNHPRFSPDGTRLAWLGMDKPVHEADKTRLRVLDLGSGKVSTLLDDFDRAPHAFSWQSDEHIVFVAQDRGRMSAYLLHATVGSVRQLTLGTTNSIVEIIPGSTDLLVGRQSVGEPTDLFVLSPSGGMDPWLAPGIVPEEVPTDAGATVRQLTHYRDTLAEVDIPPALELWYEGAIGDLQHGFVVHPPGFDPDQSYPLVLLIHGGPQGAFADSFHYRWNAAMFAAQGAVVAFLNPTGSTGYGQALTDAISGDWGGACYTDIMQGLDHVLGACPYVDPERISAAGASFGGYMVNWILGHTDRFKALVSHDGIFNSETMAYSTEELWFEEVENEGLPHTNREPHRVHSPHLFVSEFKTPTLVVQGEQDFRCPVSEGLGLFTALQVMGVPSRLVWFPDEGHWVTRPANAQVWYHEVVGWLMKYTEA